MTQGNLKRNIQVLIGECCQNPSSSGTQVGSQGEGEDCLQLQDSDSNQRGEGGSEDGTALDDHCQKSANDCSHIA